MRKAVTLFAVAACVALGVAGRAAPVAGQEDHGGHMAMPMAPPAPDTRQALDLPAPMRARMLANMRKHHEAISDILAALAQGDGARAGRIADERLGVSSMGAAACKPGAASGNMGDMAAMMARHMPEEMRAMGLAMHESASKFAATAAKIQPGGDLKPALAELAQVTQNCASCHSAYRLK